MDFFTVKGPKLHSADPILPGKPLKNDNTPGEPKNNPRILWSLIKWYETWEKIVRPKVLDFVSKLLNCKNRLERKLLL